MRHDLLKLLEQTKVLVLDFDGTLVDSNHIKLKAFETCLAEYPEHLKAIRAYCQGSHHVYRNAKFRSIFKEILRKPYTTEIEQQMLVTYAKTTTEQVIAAAEIPGAKKFLEKFSPGRTLALLSSTPHDILLTILERRNIKHFFVVIQGAPIQKAAWLAAFAKNQKLEDGKLLFIGDTFEDAEAAKTARIPFLGVGEALREKTRFHIHDFEQVVT